MRSSPEITTLAARGATLTRQIDASRKRTERLARERAKVWDDAVKAGATHEQLARRAQIGKAQINKALDRYTRNGVTADD